MASGFLGGLGAGTVGSAVVRLVLDDSQYQKGLDQSKTALVSSTSTMNAKMSAFQNVAGTAFLAVGAAAAAFGVKAVQAASAQNEALIKSRVVFGEASAALSRDGSRPGPREAVRLRMPRTAPRSSGHPIRLSRVP